MNSTCTPRVPTCTVALSSASAGPPGRAVCDTALTVSNEIALTKPTDLDGASAASLAKLDQVFKDFFTGYDQYRADLPAWQSKYYPGGTTDFSQFVKKAKDAGAEVMTAQVIPPDAVALWKTMKSLGYQPKTAWPEKGGTVGFDQAAGPLAEGASVFGWWTPTNGNTGGAAVYDANKAAFGDGIGSQAVVSSYAMVQIMVDAITRAGSTEPDAINKALGETKDLATVLAKITIGADHRAVIPVSAVQWQGANQPTIWPADQATAKFEAPVPGLAS